MRHGSIGNGNIGACAGGYAAGLLVNGPRFEPQLGLEMARRPGRSGVQGGPREPKGIRLQGGRV